MVNLDEKAKQWPRTKSGEPIFKTTHEALFYANLIYNNKLLINEIDLYRRMARRGLRILRGKPDPDYNILMEIAVKGQLFRECLDEVRRIKEEYHLI